MKDAASIADRWHRLGRGARPRGATRKAVKPRTGRFSILLSRTFRLLALLVVIVAAILSTTLLDRATQIFVVKVFLVAILSLLPGWLYLQFIAVKGIGLYDEFVLNLFRLKIDDIANLPKPPPGSDYWKEWNDRVAKKFDISRNIYAKKFEAVYGRWALLGHESRRQRRSDRDDPSTSGARIAERIKADAFSPVVLATALLCVGWTVVIQPEIYRNLNVLGSISISGLPEIPIEPLRFGFIGAYTFIVQSFVRRYFQIDLKTQAFVSAIARLVVVAALVMTLHLVPAVRALPSGMEATLAFFIGIFPDFGLRLIHQAVSGAVRGSPAPEDERHSLRELDGLTLWMQVRFLEEGMEGMQNLATANLVDLMLNTRTPINRLLDWIDQSFLYLKVDAAGNGHSDRQKLRRLGIRTATDLFDAFEPIDDIDPTFNERLLRVLNRDQAGKDDNGPSVTEGLRRSLDGEVNLWHIRQWKKHSWLRGSGPDGTVVPSG